MFLLLNLLLTIFFASNYNGKQECPEKIDKAYINSVDLIAIVTVDFESGSPEYPIGKVSTVYKGAPGGEFVIDLKLNCYDFKVDQEYLVFATKIDSDKYYVSKCSRTNLLADAQEDVNYLNSAISCFAKDLVHNGACYRMYDPVCGCDLKTYGNSCEARRVGIAIYSFGACKKK